MMRLGSRLMGAMERQTRLQAVGRLLQSSRQFHGSAVVLNKKILISDSIEQSCVDILKEAGYSVVTREKVPKDEMLKIIPEFDGLIVRSGTKVTKDIINAGTRLQLIGRAGTGVDNIDVDSATKRGKMVMNTPGGNTTSAAELTVSLLMALSRQIPAANASLKAGKWDRKKFMGTELAGKTIGIVGLGQIGRRVALSCQGLGMKTIGYDPLLSPEVAREQKIELVTLDKLYANSDFITLHTPLTAETRKLFSDATFEKCKNGVRIVNCARGGIIDEDALLRALKTGKVAGAALDVFEQEPPPESIKELLAHPNIICTPHLGASTEEAQEKVAQEIARQFVDAFEGRRISGVVNSKILAELSARKELQPYVELADRLGRLQAQLLTGNLQKITLTTRGSMLKDSRGLLTAAALKGVLSEMVSEPVNYINAPVLAEEMGLRIEEVHETDPSMSGHTVNLTFHTDKKDRTLVGTVNPDQQPRLVQVDDYAMELTPEGYAIFFSNQDKPGILAKVCSLLGSAGVNIGSFALGRSGPHGNAIGALSVDSPVPEAVIAEIRALKEMNYVQMTQLPALEEIPAPKPAPGLAGKPGVRPASANFGSGPCKKFPGYDVKNLSPVSLGRSHRSKLGLGLLQQLISDSKRILNLPKDYYLGIVPASDTGAFEMAMWSLLGPKPVDVFSWESFGKAWESDITKELKLSNVRKFSAEYGKLPDLSQANPDHDVVFTWNGTTSGVKVPNGDWISDKRTGLTLCDATSAVFAMDMPWNKLDVVTYSWQKALGGEGAHGVLILSPRAVERLNTYQPSWPMPKLFRLTKKGKFIDDVFVGKVINTPSMLCVEDCLAALKWADSIGGLPAMMKRSQDNLAALEEFVAANPEFSFLAQDKAIRSNTSVCLTVNLPPEQLKKMTKLLTEEKVAYDIDAYRDAPPGLRIWCGSTVETKDVQALTKWLKWAYTQVKSA